MFLNKFQQYNFLLTIFIHHRIVNSNPIVNRQIPLHTIYSCVYLDIILSSPLNLCIQTIGTSVQPNSLRAQHGLIRAKRIDCKIKQRQVGKPTKYPEKKPLWYLLRAALQLKQDKCCRLASWTLYWKPWKHHLVKHWSIPEYRRPSAQCWLPISLIFQGKTPSICWLKNKSITQTV